MRFRTRFSLFVLTALATFTIGVFITPRQHDQALQWQQQQKIVLRVDLTAWQVLLSFQNRDLRRLDGASERVLSQAIEVTTGKASPENSAPYFFPRLFQRLANAQGEPRYLLVEENPLRIIPGSSYLRINVFDDSGRLLNTEEFSAYRTVFTNIQIRKVPALRHEVLVVDTDYCLGGHKTREFYALVGTRITPVYVEAEGRFDATEAIIAPRIRRSVEEWEEAFSSDDDVEVLSALLWLGEDHSTEQPIISNMLARKDIRARLLALGKSANPWIKTAARSILNTD